MKTLLAYTFLIAGVAGHVAGGTPSPEIGASSAMGALTLVSGAILVLRSRRRK